MKDKWFASFFFLVLLFCFCIFLFSFDQYKKKWLVNEMDRHVQVVKEDVWTTNYTGTAGYLALVAERENYPSIELKDAFNITVLTIEGPMLTGLDYVLDLAGLLPHTTITSEITYDGQGIGSLIAHHRNMNFYVYFYLFIIFMLFYAVVIQFRKIVQVKKGLEEHVRKRTHELRLVNQQLSKNIDILNQAQEIAHAGHFEYDILKDNLVWSPEVYNILGKDMDTFTPSFADYRSLVHCEDRDDAMEKYITALKNKTDFDFETRIVLENKTIKHIQNKGKTEFDLDGKPIRTVGMMLDITDRKEIELALRESETRFKALHNASFGGIGIHDKGKILDCNAGLSELTGYSESELIGMDGLLLISEESRKKVRDFIASGYEKPYEAMGVRKNGEAFPMRIEARNIPYKGRTVRSVEFRDLTEQKKADAEKEQLQLQIIQSQKMESIGNLAGGIAHDFNNMLSPIMGYTEMLLADLPDNSPMEASLEKIYAASMRAKELVKQILTFSRHNPREQILMRIQPIVKEALKLVRSTIPRTIDINQDIRPDCGVIKADPTQIHQIIMNLTTNAFHAMEENGGEMSISLKEIRVDEPHRIDPEMKPGNYACVSVKDTGPGISEGIKEKMFDPFFTTKKEGKGTGLGLSVTHGIVKKAGGAIQVLSESGKGAEFKIYLPIAESDSAVEGKERKEVIPGGTEKILLVDDEEQVIKMEEQMLERLGYQVTSSMSSIDALEVFKLNPNAFDLVITDFAMPNMAGDKLAMEVIKIRPDIPILLWSGFSENISKERALSVGISGFLSKPILISDLSIKIRDVLEVDKVPLSEDKA